MESAIVMLNLVLHNLTMTKSFSRGDSWGEHVLLEDEGSSQPGVKRNRSHEDEEQAWHSSTANGRTSSGWLPGEAHFGRRQGDCLHLQHAYHHQVLAKDGIIARTPISTRQMLNGSTKLPPLFSWGRWAIL